MKSVDPNNVPQWSVSNDPKKIQHIAYAVEKYLRPKYSENKEWCKFYDFLSSYDAFVSSNHFYRYLNTFGFI